MTIRTLFAKLSLAASRKLKILGRGTQRGRQFTRLDPRLYYGFGSQLKALCNISMVFNPESADFISLNSEDSKSNELLSYLQHQPPEVLTRVAQSVSGEIRQIISHNVQGLVGVLPADGFNVQINTDRENLAGLLASAMMTGYFLRQMEQRMELETTLSGSLDLDRDSED